jgi:hypothetical protein
LWGQPVDCFEHERNALERKRQLEAGEHHASATLHDQIQGRT